MYKIILTAALLQILKCEVNYLNSMDQSYFENIQIQNTNFDDLLGFQYGIWTKYQPLASIKLLGEIQSANTDCSLFHYVTYQSIEQLIYYLCFDNENKKIEHTVQLISYDQQKHTQKLTIENDYHYEGTWFYYHLVCIPKSKKFLIFIGTLDQINTSIGEYQDFLPFKGEHLMFHYGNCREVINEQLKPLTLASFRGKIALYTFQQDLTIDLLYYTEAKILQMWQDEEYNLKDYYYNPYTYGLNILSEQYTIDTFIDDSYSIRGWYKLIGNLELGNKQEFLIIKPDLEKIYQHQDVAKSAYTSLQYYQKNLVNQQIILNTYSYEFPNINKFMSTFHKISDSIQLEKSLQSWQYIVLKILNDKIILTVTQENQYQLSFTVRQFTGYQSQIILCSQFANTNTQLSLQTFFIQLLKSYIPVSDDLPQCADSCLTCSGPSNYDCESCFTEGCENCTLTNCSRNCRIYKPISKQCVCHLGYFDYENYMCLGIEYTGLSLEVSNKNLQNNNCDFGYYKYQGECLKCPQVRSEYVQLCSQCANSYFYNWDFSCYWNQFVVDGDQNSVFLTNSQNEQYLLNNYEFILCEHCRFYYGNNFYKYYHLGEPVSIDCNSGYIFFNNECVRYKNIINEQTEISCSEDNCRNCYQNICNLCLDPSLTYLGLFNPIKCLPCLIQNCKYCFDYSLSDYSINSYKELDRDQILNFDDIVTGCALCYTGYVYNEKTRTCEDSNQPEYCQQAIINNNDELVCLMSNQRSIVSLSYRGCQDLIKNCQDCLQTSDSYVCVQCQLGYQIELEFNTCIVNTYSYAYKQYYYINEAQIYYYYLTNSLIIPNQYIIIKSVCKMGYIDYNWQCYQNQLESCQEQKILPSSNVICSKYFPNSYGIYSKPEVSDDFMSVSISPTNCTYYCQQCAYDQRILNLNTEYQNSNYMKCLISQNNMKIDSDYGRVLLFPSTSVTKKKEIKCIFYNYLLNKRLTMAMVNFDYEILEILNVDKLIYEFILIGDIEDYCSVQFLQSFLAYKQSVLTIRDQVLIIKSKENQIYKLGKPLLQIERDDINTLELSNLMVLINNSFNYKFVSIDKMIKLTNITFQGQNTQQNIQIQFNSFEQIQLQNISIRNVYLLDNLILSYQTLTLINLSYQELIIKNLTIKDCIFDNSQLIELVPNALYTNIIVEQIEFINVQFNNSFFIYLLDSDNEYHFTISYVFIKDCIFSNYSFINIPFNSYLTIQHFYVYNTQIDNSKLIQITQQTDLSNFEFINSTIINFTELFQFSLDKPIEYFVFKFNNCSFKDISLINTKIISINLYVKNTIQIQLTQFTHNVLVDESSIVMPLYLIKKNDQTQIQNKDDSVLLQNFVFSQSNQNVIKSLSFWDDCFLSKGIHKFFQINSISNIQINTISIKNFIFRDIVIFEITNVLKIVLLNLIFDSNLLINQQNGKDLGFLNLITDQQSEIYLNNISFTNNMIHAYIQNKYLKQGVFLSIEATQSYLIINNIQLIDNFNSLFNSPLFSVDCNTIDLESLQSYNTNYQINQNFIIQLSDEFLLYQREFAKSRFSVVSDIGIGSLSFNSFKIGNSSFSNGYSKQISIFQLIGKDNPLIEMNNIEIFNYSSSLQKDNSLYGCFSLISSSGIFNIYINNLTASNINSRLESALFYFQVTSEQLYLQITNCKMTNIFSLRNGFISIDLGKSFSKNNQIYFKNISFLNEENAFNNYLKSLIRLSDAEITQATSKSGFIFISNSKVDFEDIHFSGSWIGPINQLENIQNVTFLKNTFNNIQTIQSLLNIKLQDQNHLTLKQINMRNIKQIISNASTHNNLQKLEYDLSSQIDCQLHFRQDMVVLQQNKQEILLIDPQQLIFQLQNQILGFIIISQNQNNILISNSYFQELSCTQCKYGGIYIESSQYSNTTIINTIFKQSSYQSAGSIYIMGDQTNFIKIETCKFQENSCQYGCGISISNSRTKIANSEFIKNQAIEQGAGLQFDGLHLNLTTTSFFNNTAQIGSAVYLTKLRLDSYQLQTNNFIDNSNVQIREIPSNIDCYFNENQLQKVTAQNGTDLIEFAQDTIYLPSSIPFSEYKRFNEKRLKYDEQNFSLQFVPLNQIIEPQVNFQDSKCIYRLFIYNNDTKLVSAQLLEKQILFNSNIQAYEIEAVQFDPYKPDNYLLQITIQCDLIDSYSYYLNAKTFFCQMGEYYSQEGCHYCEYTKGYYSVKANSSKCSQIDINKISSNTANLLNLRKGFWRIDSHSEQIEECTSDSCLGGWEVGQASCQEGYIGALCQECDLRNQYTQSQSNTCLPCQDSWGSIISLILLSLWTLISIALTVKSVQNANQQFKFLVLTNRFYQILSKYNQDVPGCLIKMLQNSILIVGAVYSIQQKLTINMNWIEQFSAPTLTNAFSLDCWLSRQDYVDVLYLRMFLLVLLSLFFINVFVSGYLVFLSIKKTKYDSSTLIIAVIYIFIITQPDNIKYSSSLVASRTISDVRWIQQNISYLYDTDTHYQWITLAIVPLIIIWGILIPLFLTFILFHNRNNLSKIAFRRNWSYLFQEYQTKSYFWEIVKIVSRELQILVLTVFKQETLNNICLLFFIEFMYLTLIGKIQPYNMEELNQLEIQSVQKSILILILGLFTFSANNGYIKIISEFMLVFTTMSLILPFLFKLLKIYFNKYLISFRNLIKNYGFMKKLLNLTSQDLDKKRRARERFQKIKAKLLDRVQTFQRFERVYNESLVTDQTTNTFNRKMNKVSLQVG